MTTAVESLELEQVAALLADRALGIGAVAKVTVGSGLSMFAYPSESCLIVGIGLQRDAVLPATVDNVMTRRAETPQFFAPWLPAQFSDGSFFILRRLQRHDGNSVSTPSQLELSYALALLAP